MFNGIVRATRQPREGATKKYEEYPLTNRESERTESNDAMGRWGMEMVSFEHIEWTAILT